MVVTSYLDYAWPITAVVTLCTGLAAFGFNTLKVLHLDMARKAMQYISGVAGLVSLYCWFTARKMIAVGFSGNPKLASITWFITGLVALCVGLASIGFDLIKTVKLNAYRQILQYVAAVFGVYSLVAYFGMV